jgi:flagellin-like hook-associated protein FlgL
MIINDSGSQHLTANDLFTVKAYSAGYYRGNDDQLTVQVGKNNNFIYNINGASAFTAAGGPVAVASVVGAGAGLTANGTITLTRGASAGSWTLTGNAQYPNMVITSTSASTVTIDADNDGTNDITLDLSGKWNANNTASFTVTAGPAPQVSAVTVHGSGTVDLLATLNTLKTTLEAHDVTSVSGQIADLKNIQTQVLQKQTEAGAKASSLDLASSNHTAFTEQLTSMKSGIEDADLAKLITSFQMQQIALQASYNLAAQIGKMTIMNYLTP